MKCFMVTKKAQILRVVGMHRTEKGVTYSGIPVRSDPVECWFNDVKDADVELVHVSDVSIVSEKYNELRKAVDDVLGF